MDILTQFTLTLILSINGAPSERLEYAQVYESEKMCDATGVARVSAIKSRATRIQVLYLCMPVKQKPVTKGWTKV